MRIAPQPCPLRRRVNYKDRHNEPKGQQDNKRNKLQDTEIIKAVRTLLFDDLQAGISPATGGGYGHNMYYP